MRRCVPSFLLAVALTSGSVSAQTSAGALVGLVRDPAAAAIPQAAVTVTNTQRNVTSGRGTAGRENYSLPTVRPRTYSVTCGHPGSRGAVMGPVTVRVNQTVRADLTCRWVT